MQTQLFRSFQRKRWMTLAAVTLVALAASVSQVAWALPGGHGGHGGHGMDGGPRHMERLLDDIKASPEQRAQIKQITTAAHNDMAAHREAGRKLREQSSAVFTQANVDARAAEALRQQKLAHHDQASKRMLQMQLDISRVLTPEQRSTMADRMSKRHELRQRHQQERQALDKPRG